MTKDSRHRAACLEASRRCMWHEQRSGRSAPHPACRTRAGSLPGRAAALHGAPRPALPPSQGTPGPESGKGTGEAHSMREGAGDPRLTAGV